jgi:Tol biopolymer transport system component
VIAFAPVSLEKSPQSFEPAFTSQVGLGDLDGDGDLDAFFANMRLSHSQVWLNDGTGHFVDTGQELTRQAHGVALGDLDGDGDLDAFVPVAGYTENDIDYVKPSKVYLNDGDGTFRDSGQDLGDTDLSGTDVNLFDVDQDRDLDALAVYHQAPNRVYLNDGNGVFTDSGRSFPEGTIWGDLDSDGDVDAFIKERGQGYKTMLDDGAGNFTDHWQLEDSDVLYGKVVLGDLDADGDLDALVANGDNSASQPTTVLMNDGTGRFSDSGQRLSATHWASIGLGDLNGDGSLDAYVTNFLRPDDVWVWINDGTGHFFDSDLNLVGTEGAIRCTLGDLDDDGDLDVFVADFAGGANEIWFNETQTPESGPLPGLSGGMIAFLSDRVAGTHELYVMPAPGPTDDAAEPRRLVTAGDGFCVGPSWSPDGQRIAYAKIVPDERGWLDNHGPFEIWATTLDGAENILLSADISDEIKALPWPTPTWSPDGRRLAFIAARETDEGTLSNGYVVAADGGGLEWSFSLPWLALDVSWSPLGDALLLVGFDEESGLGVHVLSIEERGLVEVYQDAQAADWSPDGSEIVLSPAQSPDVIILEPGGEPRTVARLEKFPLAVSWSPDGEHILVGTSHSSSLTKITALHLVSLDTGASTTIAEYDHGKYIYAPNWSPGSDRVLYTTTDLDRIRQGNILHADLWVYDLPSGQTQQLTSGEFHDGMGVWSPSQTLEPALLPAEITDTTQISSSAVQTITDRTKIAPYYKLVRITLPETADFDPYWSPDGQSIAFASWRARKNEIYVIPAEGGAARQITFQGAYHPSWSPDGTTIAFASSAIGGDDDIWTVPAAGGKSARITTNSNREEYLDWCSEGGRIIFDSNRSGNWDIWSVPAEGGDPVRITRNPASELSPSCSPDGSTVVFLSDRSGDFDLYTIPIEGGTATRLTNGMGSFGYSDWSPDGARVVFMSDRRGNPDLWIVSVADGTLTQLTAHPDREDHPNWSPDGKKIAFTSGQNGDGDIWILYLESTYE